MKPVLRAFGRALLCVLHPRMLIHAILPLILIPMFWAGILWWAWDPVTQAFNRFLDATQMFAWLSGTSPWSWLAGLGPYVAPVLVVMALCPLIVVSMLIYISVFFESTVAGHVARGYPGLRRAQGGSLMGGLRELIVSTGVFLVLTMLTLPLAYLPVIGFVTPSLLSGWLMYRVMTYDALEDHATVEERKTLMKRHRTSLMGIGVLSGFLGWLANLVWVWAIVMVILLPLALLCVMWVYMMILIFAVPWYGHFCLQALADLRAERATPLPHAMDGR